MKTLRAFLLAALLGLAATVSGGWVTSGPQTALLSQRVDADALKWRTAVVSAGGSVSTPQLRRISTLIATQKAAGVWQQLDREWVFAAENATQALIDLKARSSATAVNSPTFTAWRGYAGNGSTSYVNTNFNTSTGTLFTQNSAHWGVWQRTAKTVGAVGNHGNVNTDAGTNGVYVDFSSPGGRINDAGGAVSPAIVGGVGHLLLNRTAAAVSYAYYNGAKGVLNSTASQTPQNLTLWIGGRNLVGSINQASNAQVSAATAGAGLTDAQVLALYNTLAVYQAATP
jgi:hypothetical protein